MPDQISAKKTSPKNEPKVAIIMDWLKDWGWAEQVCFDILAIYPNARIFTSSFDPKRFPSLVGRVTSSFMDRIPFVRSNPKMFPFLRPYAFESLDLTEYDIVISSSSAESKWVITLPSTLHVCYCHTPTRYYWSHTHLYKEHPEFGVLNFVAALIMPYFFHRLRLWDYAASARVDRFIANSEHTAARIAKYYRRSSVVISPGIDETEYSIDPAAQKWDYYLAVGRLIPYKRFDLLVDTFNANGLPLVIITNTVNKLMQELRARSASNITWEIDVPFSTKAKYMREAKAFMFPQEEDFGMVPIEAMLCGTPVIAFSRGGALETVVDGVSGVFFSEQRTESIAEAIKHFETLSFAPETVRNTVLKFTRREFQQKIHSYVTKEFEKLQKSSTIAHIEL